MFTSLGFLKRYDEVELAREQGMAAIRGRAYRVSEAPALSALGVGCGIAAVVILTLYIHSDDIRLYYSNPHYLLAWCPIMLFAFARLWMSATRGELHQDPLMHLLRDRWTYGLATIGAVVAYVAA